MVDLSLYLMFVAATAVLILTPGPIVSVIIAETLTAGPGNGMATVIGAATAAAAFLAVYLLGFASIIGMSDDVLNIVRYAGAAYLVYLAIESYRSISSGLGPRVPAQIVPKRSLLEAYRTSLVIAFSNPKVILFFVAFFPQFVSADLPITTQLIILSGTYLGLSILLDSLWVLAADRAKLLLASKRLDGLAVRVSVCVLLMGALLLLAVDR